MRVGVKPGQWGWSFDELGASWRAAEDAGFDLVSCFDHVTAAPEGFRAWDAPSLLVAMAAATTRVRLAVQVLNASLRHPLLVAGQVAVAQAASGGRVEVGIGAGSYHLARHLGLRDASLGPLGIERPPVRVGGSSERALAIAARYADGWHATGREEDFASLAARLDRRCSEAGRAPIPKGIQIRTGDPGRLRERVRRLEEAGADTVVVVLDADQRGSGWVRRVANAVV